MQKFFDDLPNHLDIGQINHIIDLFEKCALVFEKERGDPASLHLAFYASAKMTEYLKISMQELSKLIEKELETRDGKKP